MGAIAPADPTSHKRQEPEGGWDSASDDEHIRRDRKARRQKARMEEQLLAMLSDDEDDPPSNIAGVAAMRNNVEFARMTIEDFTRQTNAGSEFVSK